MISVIIPVFNSQDYILKSIHSALIQLEVSEVVVVDDGSIDDSVSLILKMQKDDLRIKFYQHLDKKNHGRSATRNLGIKRATGMYIAFLDSDDYYLPNRFGNDIKILEEDQSIDGVYNAISAHFYRNFSKDEQDKLKLTTIREKVNSDKLFENMGPMGHLGYFSGIGLTVKRSIFDKIGLFNESLEVAEDTELWLKMSLKTRLVGGILDKAVSIRGVHDSNVSFKAESLYNANLLKMYSSLYYWSKANNVEIRKLSKIWKKIWLYRRINNTTFKNDLLFWLKDFFSKPCVIFFEDNYKTFPIFWRLKNRI